MSYQFGHVDREERIDYGGDEPPQRLPPHWRLPRSVVAVAVVAVFAGSLWFAYHEGTKHATSALPAAGDQVPLLHPDPQPVKIKPDRPGGMNIPDQDDPIYNRPSGGPPVEHLQPPPEKPAPRPAPVAAVPAPVTAAPTPAAAAPPQVAAVPPAAAASAPTPAKPAAVKPPPAPAKPAPTVAGSVKIQLGSLRSPDAARDEWQRLKRENGDLLGKFTAVAVRSEVPDKGTYYRVEVGPVGDHAAAERLCKALKERDLGCSLVR